MEGPQLWRSHVRRISILDHLPIRSFFHQLNQANLRFVILIQIDHLKGCLIIYLIIIITGAAVINDLDLHLVSIIVMLTTSNNQTVIQLQLNNCSYSLSTPHPQLSSLPSFPPTPPLFFSAHPPKCFLACKVWCCAGVPLAKRSAVWSQPLLVCMGKILNHKLFPFS